MQQQIKNLRLQIDGISQLVKELKPKKKFVVDLSQLPCKEYNKSVDEFIKIFEESGYMFIDSSLNQDSKFNAFQSLPLENKEIDKCYDSLILAKAWLGKVLGELGEETPYKNDGNRKIVEDIEPTSDVMKDSILGNPHKYRYENDYTYIEKIDKLREEIALALQHPSGIEKLDRTDSDRMLRVLTFMSYFNKYTAEARFWLGFELQRLKEESDLNKSKEIVESK